jgi:hypothetical protein
MGETTLFRKILLILAITCGLYVPGSPAQRDNPLNWHSDSPPRSQIIKEFERSATHNGIKFRFVLLNNDTVESLFRGAGKYAIRARANMTTVFYIGGKSERDAALDTGFFVEQDGKVHTGEIIDIQNFKSGLVTRGTKIDGLLQLNEKIDVTRRFAIRGPSNFSLEFELSPDALRWMAK